MVEPAPQADVLASQVLVTAPLPSGFDASQATVQVVLPTAGEPVIARALAPIQSASGEEEVPSAPEAQLDTPGGWNAPEWVLHAGIAVLGVGLVTVAVLLVPGRPAPMSIAERVEAYSTRTRGEPAKDESGDPDRAMLPRLAGPVHVSRRHPLKQFSEAEWQGEERSRYLNELAMDMNRARAEAAQFDPALSVPPPCPIGPAAH